MIDLLIVDDHAIFRSGLQRLMLDESDIRVAGQASNVGQALEQLQQGRFSLVLLDINLEGRSGLDLLASIRIKWPRLPVLVLSMYPETQYALVAIREGANGYVAKDAEPAELPHFKELAVYVAGMLLVWLNLTREDLIPPVVEEVDELP